MKASIISASILIILCSTICTTNAATMSTKFEDCSLKNDNHYPYNTSSPGGTFVPLQVNATYDKIPLVLNSQKTELKLTTEISCNSIYAW